MTIASHVCITSVVYTATSEVDTVTSKFYTRRNQSTEGLGTSPKSSSST